MGTWRIVDRDQDGSAAPIEPGTEDVYVYAPTLRSLPQGYPMVMATLPITDWNAELHNALVEIPPRTSHRMYAAVFMTDPFTLWEDLAELLKEKGFEGVINFPPAILAEGMLSGETSGSGHTAEIDRLKWFHENGLSLAYAAASTAEIADISSRLGCLLEAVVFCPASALAHPVTERLELEPFDDQAHRVVSSPTIWQFPPSKAPPENG